MRPSGPGRPPGGRSGSCSESSSPRSPWPPWWGSCSSGRSGARSRCRTPSAPNRCERKPWCSSASPVPCPGADELEPPDCSAVTVRLATGRQDGETVELQQTGDPAINKLGPGDRIVVAELAGDDPGAGWYFEDYARRQPLLLLAVLFVVAVMLLGPVAGFRWPWSASAFSLLLLVRFVLPVDPGGSSDPVAVALVGSAAIMFVALYLAHGFNVRTTSAVAGHPRQPGAHRAAGRGLRPGSPT